MNNKNDVQPWLPGLLSPDSRISYEGPVPEGRLNGFLIVNNMLDQQYSTNRIMAVNVLTGGGALKQVVVPASGIALYGGRRYWFVAL
ncbi:MAG: hypothetical protein AB7V39_18635 [Nitrospiraceae bacterium]